MIRVTVQWTDTAKKQLVGLPKKAQRGLARKVGSLADSDPRRAGKALVGPFMGYRRITYGRYRALFSADEHKLANGNILIHMKVTVVAVGIRKERDRHDVYKVAKKLVDLGIIPSHETQDDEHE